MQFIANIFFKGKIKCLTGLHIGGGQDKLEIGGVDSIVIRDPKTQYPMIPGSSLRGKLRTMLEFGLGAIHKGNPAKKIEAGSPSDFPIITRLFGKGADEKTKDEGPTRLIVRDCMPDEPTIQMWKDIETELLYTEYKSENTINRLTSAANPRFIERVVAESAFDFEIILSVYSNAKNEAEDDKNLSDEEKSKKQKGIFAKEVKSLTEDIQNIFMGFRLIEHSWLGKSGSRGYGKVSFLMDTPSVLTQKDYIENPDNICKKATTLNSENLSVEDFNQKQIEAIILKITQNEQ